MFLYVVQILVNVQLDVLEIFVNYSFFFGYVQVFRQGFCLYVRVYRSLCFLVDFVKVEQFLRMFYI